MILEFVYQITLLALPMGSQDFEYLSEKYNFLLGTEIRKLMDDSETRKIYEKMSSTLKGFYSYYQNYRLHVLIKVNQVTPEKIAQALYEVDPSPEGGAGHGWMEDEIPEIDDPEEHGYKAIKVIPVIDKVFTQTEVDLTQLPQPQII